MVLPESPAISSAPLPWGARTAGRHCASPDDGNRTPPRCSAAGSPKNPGNLNGFIPVPNDQAQGLPTPAGSHAENRPAREFGRHLRAVQEARAAFPVCDRSSDIVSRPARSSHRSEEHTSELQSLMRISYAVFCLKKKKKNPKN